MKLGKNWENENNKKERKKLKKGRRDREKKGIPILKWYERDPIIKQNKKEQEAFHEIIEQAERNHYHKEKRKR